MAFDIPALPELRTVVRDRVRGASEAATLLLPKSMTRALADGVAGLAHLHFRYQGWVARMVIPLTAEGAPLQRWLDLWLAVPRIPAAAATGTITVTGATGSSVDTGTALTVIGETSLEVVVTTGGTIGGAGTLSLPAAAGATGTAGNHEAGVGLSFVSVPEGVDARAVVAAPGFAGGAEAERDAAAKGRMIARIQEPPHGGNAADYVQWAKEASSNVTRAWSAGQQLGVGTETVRIMMDDLRANQSGIPTTADLALVKAYIDTVRPVTVRDLFVEAPAAKAVDVEISDLESDTPEVRAEIAANLAAAFRAKAVPGGTFWGAWISEAVSAAVGERHHTIPGLADTTCAAGEIAVLGDVTYS
ncbi:baseplate J/gp47 family protein [Amorphus sp. 3PC139-8]|uniref:baseplate J/gp47 family protein n=1 Tax=Amorphus sp. 3PC139-8 TaxID=2735676 RepID=UPI00345CC484